MNKRLPVAPVRIMRTRPAWLTYAGGIKAKIDRLPRSKSSPERRVELVYRSFLRARDRLGYPGTLSDWEFVVEESKLPGSKRLKISHSGVSSAAAKRTKISSDGLRTPRPMSHM